MNTANELTQVLSIRRISSLGFGTKVAVRVEHEGRVRTLALGRDEPIEGLGHAGARAIRDAIEEYEDAWDALDVEGRMRLLWQETNEHLVYRTRRTEEAILSAVPEVRRAQETDRRQAADTSDLLEAVERENKVERERTMLLEFIQLVLGNSVLHRWEREDENAEFLALHERNLREQADGEADGEAEGSAPRRTVWSSNAKLIDPNQPSQRRND
ncbi:MAG: hypothetical protein KC619_08655 [Myxococcales bacterium]|nr:hypothetical protein [Myxococcales bacterium]